MSNVLGIVAFENRDVRVEGLDDYRSIPAISFLGRYRLIDFAISNMSNSGIDNIKVFVKKQPRSLIEQLGTGRHYNINSKRGSLQILYGEGKEHAVGIYDHDINAYNENMQFIEDAKEQYIVLAPGYMVYALDYNKVVKAHIENGADVTIVYKSTDVADKVFIGGDVLELTRDKQVASIERNVGKDVRANVSLETYVMSRKLFVDLVHEANRTSSLYTFKDILKDVIGPLKVMGYQYRGYAACINSFEAYYKVQMDMLNNEFDDDFSSLFKEEWPIHTRTNDSPPAYYSETSFVKNSMVANGCVVEGEVENCVLGRGVVIKKGCKITNSIILPQTYIGENAVIDCAVVDKKARIENVKTIVGTPESPAYIKRRDRI